MKKLIVLVGVALVAVGMSGAFAAGDTKFAQEDSNHDGKMTWDEAHAAFPTLSQVLFNAADEDHNGWLSETEYTGLYTLCPN